MDRYRSAVSDFSFVDCLIFLLWSSLARRWLIGSVCGDYNVIIVYTYYDIFSILSTDCDSRGPGRSQVSYCGCCGCNNWKSKLFVKWHVINTECDDGGLVHTFVSTAAHIPKVGMCLCVRRTCEMTHDWLGDSNRVLLTRLHAWLWRAIKTENELHKYFACLLV